jgi:hypothetical protein
MFTQAIVKGRKQDPETHPWYWNPNRIGAVQAPSWFMAQVEAISADLDVRFNPVSRKWGVWARAPKVQHPLCQGWRLLFVNQDTDGSYLPLDERVMARLHLIDMTNTSARAYFDRISAEFARDKAARERQLSQDTLDLAIERGWDHSRIQVSMRGQSDGSKFSKYHS